MWRPSTWIIRRMDSLRAEISLLPISDGGRGGAVDLGGRYMPHLRVDGGSFSGSRSEATGQPPFEPGGSGIVTIDLLYDIDYGALAPEPSSRFLKATGGSELG